MPLISHEIPKCLFNRTDFINDYPYALGHLLNKDKEYSDYYREQFKKHKFSILDNSIFELGHSISFEELHELGKEYNPYLLVLPDVLGDMVGTVDNAVEYLSKYAVNNQKYLGVAQGSTFKDIHSCIELYMQLGLEHIALPYDLIKGADNVTTRYRFLCEWVATYEKTIYRHMPPKFHLLGCESPVEFLLYKSNPVVGEYVYSIDTSSPIINGWKLQEFTEHGLAYPKPKDKLAENLDIELSMDQLEVIFKNIKLFREFINF